MIRLHICLQWQLTNRENWFIYRKKGLLYPQSVVKNRFSKKLFHKKIFAHLFRK